MQWNDEAILLGVRRHGENSVIAEMMTRERGRHLGLVRSGRSRTMQPVLQPGNRLDISWRARLDEHLGEYRIEPLRLRAAELMQSATASYGVLALAALLRLLPERDPHPHLYEALDVIVDHLGEPRIAGELFVRFEVAVLNDLGFGLDLSCCAVTGSSDDLVYVSPRSGRAVSRIEGRPYADRLLALPSFLAPIRVQELEDGGDEIAEEMARAFFMTGYFLRRHVWEPRGIEPGAARDGFLQATLKALRMADRPATSAATEASG